MAEPDKISLDLEFEVEGYDSSSDEEEEYSDDDHREVGENGMEDAEDEDAEFQKMQGNEAQLSQSSVSYQSSQIYQTLWLQRRRQFMKFPTIRQERDREQPLRTTSTADFQLCWVL